MKKADIAMVVLIASVSAMVAFFAARAIFGDVYNGSAKVKTIQSIDSNVVEPSKDIFNSNAINPAVPVQIGGSTNSGSQ